MAKKILYVITEDWFFCSHFIARAEAARDAGYEVAVAAREGQHGDEIRRAGLAFIPLRIDRRGMNPLVELRTIFSLWRIYRRQRPDIVHHVALKPILYGTLAALLGGCPHIVNAPVGMGFVFTSRRLLARCLKPLVMFGMRRLLNPGCSRVVFENRDDLSNAVQEKLVKPEAAILIRGAGVDTQACQPVPEPDGPVSVVLAARMLWDKGIKEFVEAALIVRQHLPETRFLLVGAPDKGNPASIPVSELVRWQNQGSIEWLGHRTDVIEILSRSHIACLPSYREGLPKFLLEALAAARSIVATDVPGCREAIVSGFNGLLVPPQDAIALAEAILALAMDPDRRRIYGERGRKRVEEEFASSRVIAETLALYQNLAS